MDFYQAYTTNGLTFGSTEDGEYIIVGKDTNSIRFPVEIDKANWTAVIAITMQNEFPLNKENPFVEHCPSWVFPGLRR